MANVKMVDLDFLRIPLINSTNEYVLMHTYRIPNDIVNRYFVFVGESEKGNMWQEVPVTLTSWN